VGIFLLYNILNFFKIKKKEKFMTILFLILSIIVLGIVGVRFFSFILGDGRTMNSFHPFIYAIAMLFPVLAFSYGVNSGMMKDKGKKVKWFSITLVAFGVIIASYFVSTLNNTIWWLLELLPNFLLNYKFLPCKQYS